MNQEDQIASFSSDLDRLVERYRSEFDLTYAAVVGVLHMKAHMICAESEDFDGEEEEEEEA